jgi:hypothetical protein
MSRCSPGIDLDVPYVPSQAGSGEDYHIDIDAVKENYPVWGFPVDILIQAVQAKPAGTEPDNSKRTHPKQTFRRRINS